MRIGAIAPPWLPVPPHGYGGVELVVDVLARGYVAAGHDVTLFTVAESTCPVPRIVTGSYHVPDDLSPAVAELGHVVTAYRHAARCDVIHDHSELGPVLARAYPATPVVATVHGPFDELAGPYDDLASHVHIVALTRDHASRRGPVPVSAVIPHGLDLTRYPTGDGTGGYALFLGRMTPKKGPHRAVLAARDAGIPLLIAGTMRQPHERAYFRTTVAPLLDADRRYVGEVDHAGKVDLLRHAVTLLLPIRWPEPFGLVMAEALACGTPVIAFAEGSAPEIVSDGRTGLLCHDEDGMARALGRVAELDRSACRAAAENRFDAATMIRRYLTLFERVLTAR